MTDFSGNSRSFRHARHLGKAFLAASGLVAASQFMPDFFVSTKDGTESNRRIYHRGNPLTVLHQANLSARNVFHSARFRSEGTVNATLAAIGRYPESLFNNSERFWSTYSKDFRAYAYVRFNPNETAAACYISPPGMSGIEKYMHDATSVPTSHMTPTATDATLVYAYIIDHERDHCREEMVHEDDDLAREALADIAAGNAGKSPSTTEFVRDLRSLMTLGNIKYKNSHATALFLDAFLNQEKKPSTDDVKNSNDEVNAYIQSHAKNYKSTHIIYRNYHVLKDALVYAAFSDPVTRRVATLYTGAVERQLGRAPIVRQLKMPASVPVFIVPGS